MHLLYIGGALPTFIKTAFIERPFVVLHSRNTKPEKAYSKKGIKIGINRFG